MVLRSAAVTKMDRFDESLKNADDRLFWIQFLSKHNGVFLNEILHDYRVVSSGITGQGMLKKGPYKISALEKAKSYCAKKELIRLLDKEIASNYIAMSRESKKNRNSSLQRLYALKSINHRPSYKALKLLVSSLLNGII